jgi:hypothetical protein
MADSSKQAEKKSFEKAEDMIAIPKCPVCGSEKRRFLKNEIYFKDEQGDIFDSQLKCYLKGSTASDLNLGLRVCPNCQTVAREMFFAPEKLKSIYEKEYHQEEEKISQNSNFIYNKDFFLRTCSKHISGIVERINKKRHAKIKTVFDIGGRDGFQVRDIAAAGYDCTVFDPIPLEGCHPAIKRERVFLEDIPAEREKADLVLLCNILEHCPRPEEVIGKCRSLLKDDGFIFIQVPFDIAAIAKWNILKTLGKKKSLRVDLTHVVFFSLKSLVYLLEMNGFKCIEQGIDPLPISEKGESVLVINILARKTDGKVNPRKSRIKDYSMLHPAVTRWLLTASARKLKKKVMSRSTG